MDDQEHTEHSKSDERRHVRLNSAAAIGTAVISSKALSFIVKSLDGYQRSFSSLIVSFRPSNYTGKSSDSSRVNVR